jgi:hypothetical protein
LTLPVLIILAALWAVVLVPPLLRSRSQRTADSIVDFNYKLDVLGKTNGSTDLPQTVPTPAPPVFSRDPVPGAAPAVAPAVAPPRLVLPGPNAADRAAKRRRDLVRGFSLAIIITLLLATATRSPAAWALQMVVDLFAGIYALLWAYMRSAQAERVEKVRYMPQVRVPELALRRSASS